MYKVSCPSLSHTVYILTNKVRTLDLTGPV